ncbi:MAG TPA: S53 family peptidase [Gaiellaceae bacterium]|nr:S53 family peptidase [Gaiellaceae bacterium]
MVVAVAALAAVVSSSAQAQPALVGTAFSLKAPGGPFVAKAAAFACEAPTATLHCNTPQDIRDAYGVTALGNQGLLGQGQTIVLVDSYGSPTAAQDLQHFHDVFFSTLPSPNFTQVFPQGKPNYNNSNGNGQSGPAAAAGWSGEATLDIEWAYAIAPLAHIVLIAVPPAETEGVQGLPNLFNAISQQIDANPPGTVFSMSFGITEQTFGGAAQPQTARFDAVFQKGIAKGDTFFASSGDSGTLGVAKQHRDSATYSYPTVGWPASSPYVTAVGGTQLQRNWRWDPLSDIPFLSDGSFNPSYFNSTAASSPLNVVWNESWLPAATGGGPSAIYPRPSWQTGVLPQQGNHRLVPDVAWDAAVNGGVLVYISAYPNYNGPPGFYIYGGTSAASPQVAALTALAVQKAGHGLGNVNPAIYAHPAAFTDVVPIHQGAPNVISGDLTSNRMFDYNGDGLPVTWDPVPGWAVNPCTDTSISGCDPSTPYDMTTGWGTPNAPAYVAALTGH